MVPRPTRLDRSVPKNSAGSPLVNARAASAPIQSVIALRSSTSQFHGSSSSPKAFIMTPAIQPNEPISGNPMIPATGAITANWPRRKRRASRLVSGSLDFTASATLLTRRYNIPCWYLRNWNAMRARAFDPRIDCIPRAVFRPE